MRRRLYLSTLLVLQLALIVKLTSPLAHALRVDAAPGMAPGGWPAILQLVATAAAVAGTSLALVFPGLALSRHRRGGALRFLGMPRWAVTLALIGGLIGIAIGGAASFAVGQLAGWRTEVSIASVFLAVGFSGAIGVFFGFYPARTASRLAPIDALRHE